LHIDERAAQLAASATLMAQSLERIVQRVLAPFAVIELGNGALNLLWTELHLVHQCARRPDFVLGHPSIGLGNMPHNRECRIEELLTHSSAALAAETGPTDASA
jgi:hypothetical protein